MILYSPTTNSFYETSLQYNDLPIDCIEISNEKHSDLLERQGNENKQIIPDESGNPILVESVSYITWDDVRILRNEKLAESDWIMLQDAKPKPNKEVWLDYRQKLRDITENFADPNLIIWPPEPI
jgi:hypothetical protein